MIMIKYEAYERYVINKLDEYPYAIHVAKVHFIKNKILDMIYVNDVFKRYMHNDIWIYWDLTK